MTSISQLLAAVPPDAVAGNPVNLPARRYMIAFTPRSGSSYLCERLERTGAAGIPREILNKDLMPVVLEQFPARSPIGYLERVLGGRASGDVSGFKTSWYQLVEFSGELADGFDHWADYRCIYLVRGDLAAQAVSLYRAVGTNVFHTNVPVDDAAQRRLEDLPYCYDDIAHWYRHLLEQERAWETWFRERSIEPLRVTYEAVHEDVGAVARAILSFLGVRGSAEGLREPSVFRKLAGSTSAQWADRFAAEHAERTAEAVRRSLPDPVRRAANS